MISQDNSTQSDFFLIEGVEKRFSSDVRVRIETLLAERGLKWSEVYQKLGWHKTFASKVFNGRYIPPLWQRVALSKVLEIDSSVIWQVPPIQSAETIAEQERGESSPLEPEILDDLSYEKKINEVKDDRNN